jgi:hypothetical protein
MTKTTTILLILAAVAVAGPVGEYLGIHVGRQFADVRVGSDSIDYLYGQSYASQWSSVDTNCVTSETTLQGHHAWLSTVTSYRYDRAVSVDTAFEQGDTMLVGCRTVAGLSWHLNLYRVPFTPGSWWRSGTAGTWYADFTGDGQQDTMVVAGDTTTVMGTEDVTAHSAPASTSFVPPAWPRPASSRSSSASFHRRLDGRASARPSSSRPSGRRIEVRVRLDAAEGSASSPG